ncbi:uncharacterized protein EV420DRAFT_1475706 [Desarmillaria tabescens]|uniref:Uncharacterized protein n=1 Tax=Armillaria tabescens TaxID=1929756 RepID=A0AA39NHA2_ARMTA|nr:uncharacterized protein EV420DRAFT_1475706 [Desarmillaria tabescens]KAK0465625.1 hypothetical protein EV420DRAFT_1475706 [Desarmillaria tabescens]
MTRTAELGVIAWTTYLVSLYGNELAHLLFMVLMKLSAAIDILYSGLRMMHAVQYDTDSAILSSHLPRIHHTMTNRHQPQPNDPSPRPSFSRTFPSDIASSPTTQRRLPVPAALVFQWLVTCPSFGWRQWIVFRQARRLRLDDVFKTGEHTHGETSHRVGTAGSLRRDWFYLDAMYRRPASESMASGYCWGYKEYRARVNWTYLSLDDDFCADMTYRHLANERTAS